MFWRICSNKQPAASTCCVRSPWLAYLSAVQVLECWRWRDSRPKQETSVTNTDEVVDSISDGGRIQKGTYVAEFWFLLAAAPAASLLQQAALLQTEVLLLGHPGASPPLLEAQLFLRAASAARQHRLQPEEDGGGGS